MQTPTARPSDAGSRAKASGVLEFWVVLGVVLALIAIVVLVYLRGVAAS